LVEPIPKFRPCFVEFSEADLFDEAAFGETPPPPPEPGAVFDETFYILRRLVSVLGAFCQCAKDGAELLVREFVARDSLINCYVVVKILSFCAPARVVQAIGKVGCWSSFIDEAVFNAETLAGRLRAACRREVSDCRVSPFSDHARGSAGAARSECGSR
jgi:hypothetical protein